MRRPAQICQVPGCNADLTNLRSYFVRQHICEEHARADAVPDGQGGFLRFCQQCTKLESVAAFEGLKRSCEASLQKRHLRRSGGAAAAQRAKSSSSAGLAIQAAAYNAAALQANAAAGGMLSLPHMPMPGSSQTNNHAASSAALAAMLAGAPGDHDSPCSTGSLQQPAATTRSTSGLRGGGGGGANPLAALLEAALPSGGPLDLGGAGNSGIANILPVAPNTKDGSMMLQQLAGQHGGFPQMPRPHPQAHHGQMHQGGASWPLPTPAPWAHQPQQQQQQQQHGFSHLQAALSAAATETRLPPFPSTNSSQLPVDQAWQGGQQQQQQQQTNNGGSGAGTGSHEGQQGQQVDVQQMVGALHLLQQLQDVIGSLLVAQVQQAQAPPAPAPVPAPPAAYSGQHHGQQQHQLLSLLGGLTGGRQQAAPAPQPPPQQQQQDGQHSQAVLQVLSQMAQQQQNRQQQQQHNQQQRQQQQQLLQQYQRELAQPVLKPQPRSAAGSPRLRELPSELEAQLLQAAAGSGGEQGEQLQALLRRWVRGSPRNELA